MRILVFNCGSSSLKFEALELDAGAIAGHRSGGAIKGTVEGIGTQQAKFTYRRGETVASGGAAHDSHQAAARHAIQWMRSLEGSAVKALDAAAHRIVHGGDLITQPMIADPAVLDAIDRASVFAPLHNPAALGTIRAVAQLL